MYHHHSHSTYILFASTVPTQLLRLLIFKMNAGSSELDKETQLPQIGIPYYAFKEGGGKLTNVILVSI